MQLNTLKLNQEVALARIGFRSISNLGVYTVVKLTKLQAVLQRKSDGYEKVVSIKTGRFKNFEGKFVREDDLFIESVEEQQQRIERRQHTAMVNGLWRDVETAASRKNLVAIKQLLAKLESETV